MLVHSMVFRSEARLRPPRLRLRLVRSAATFDLIRLDRAWELPDHLLFGAPETARVDAPLRHGVARSLSLAGPENVGPCDRKSEAPVASECSSPHARAGTSSRKPVKKHRPRAQRGEQLPEACLLILRGDGNAEHRVLLGTLVREQ